MQTLRLSFLLPNADNAPMQLHVSSNDSHCDVVVELPVRSQPKGNDIVAPDTPMSAEDEYVLGGYAGI